MPDEENQTAVVSRICNFLKKSNQNFDVGPLRAFAGLCGPLRAFAGLCGPLRAFAGLCGPLRAFARNVEVLFIFFRWLHISTYIQLLLTVKDYITGERSSV